MLGIVESVTQVDPVELVHGALAAERVIPFVLAWLEPLLLGSLPTIVTLQPDVSTKGLVGSFGEPLYRVASSEIQNIEVSALVQKDDPAVCHP